MKKKNFKTDTFKKQMLQSMAELSALMSAGQSPTGNGRLSIRTIEVAEPSEYGADDVKKARASLNVSQAVFAKLVGVSDVLVRSWERGARAPAPIARPLLDQIREHPGHFVSLVRPFEGTASANTARPIRHPWRPVDRKRKRAG